MNNNTNTALTQIGLGGDAARDQFLKLLTGTPEQKQALALLISASPQTALAVIASGTSGLTIRGNADALDAVLETIEDPAEARELAEQSLTTERRAELLAARGDLPSSAAYILSKEDVLAAILHDIGGATGVEAALVVMVWAHKLADRDDWAAILRMKIGEKSIRALVVTGLVVENGNEMPAGNAFERVGIAPDKGRLLARRHRKLSANEIAEARAALLKRKAAKKNAPLVEKAADAATMAADKIDF